MRRQMMAITLALSLLYCAPAFGWNDITHMAVVKAAGLDDFAYLAVGADMAKEKSGGHEEGNHYRDNHRNVVVTADMVLDQVRDYNCRCYGEGHLYGAIVATVNEYWQLKIKERYARYPLGYAAHYIGDLSMPLHNVDYNDFNKVNHAANDGVVEKGERGSTDERVAGIARNIQQRMRSIAPYQLPPAKRSLKEFDAELAKKIAEIANRAKALGYAMQDSNPPRPIMSIEEAYHQLAESAVLLKAVYAATQ